MKSVGWEPSCMSLCIYLHAFTFIALLGLSSCLCLLIFVFWSLSSCLCFLVFVFLPIFVLHNFYNLFLFGRAFGLQQYLSRPLLHSPVTYTILFFIICILLKRKKIITLRLIRCWVSIHFLKKKTLRKKKWFLQLICLESQKVVAIHQNISSKYSVHI